MATADTDSSQPTPRQITPADLKPGTTSWRVKGLLHG